MRSACGLAERRTVCANTPSTALLAHMRPLGLVRTVVAAAAVIMAVMTSASAQRHNFDARCPAAVTLECFLHLHGFNHNHTALDTPSRPEPATASVPSRSATIRL